MAHDVFISHSVKDKAIADAVCHGLESRGIRCWIAPRDILPGAEWGDAILSAIRKCKVMIVIFSGHANASAQVKREVNCAVEDGRAILPLRIEGVHPDGSLKYLLSTTHWLDALTPPFQQHLDPLIDIVTRLLSPEAADNPPRTGPPPLPVNYGSMHGIPPTYSPPPPRPRRSPWPWVLGGLFFIAVALGAVAIFLVLRPKPAAPAPPADPFAGNPFPRMSDLPIVKPSLGTGPNTGAAVRWQIFEDEAGRFSILVPGEVTKEVQNANTALGKIEMHLFQAQLDDAAFMVMYGDYPHKIVTDDIDKTLEAGVEGMVGNTGGQLRSNVDLDVQGNPGRDVTLEIAVQGLMIKARFCLENGSRLYIWVAVTPREKIMSANVLKFLDSFYITSPPAAPNPNNAR